MEKNSFKQERKSHLNQYILNKFQQLQLVNKDASSENSFSQDLKLQKTSSLDDDSKNVIEDYDDEEKDEEYSIWDEKDLKSNGICTDKFIDSRGNQLQFYQIYRLRSALYQNSYVSRFDTFKQVLNISTHFNRKLSLNQLKKQQNYLDSFFKMQQKDYVVESEKKLTNDKYGDQNQKNDFSSKSSITSSSNEKVKDKNNKQLKNTYQNAARIQEKNISQKINEYYNRRQSLKLLLNKSNIIQKIITQDQQLFQNNLKKHDDNLNQADSQNQKVKEQLIYEKEKFQPKLKNEFQKKNIEQKIYDYYTRRQSLKLLLNKGNIFKKTQMSQNNLKKHDVNLNQPNPQKQNLKGQLVWDEEKSQQEIIIDREEMNLKQKMNNYYNKRSSLKLLQNKTNNTQKIVIQEQKFYQNCLKTNDDDDDTVNQFISQKEVLNDNRIDHKEILRPVKQEEKNLFVNQNKKENILQTTISFISKLKQKLFK